MDIAFVAALTSAMPACLSATGVRRSFDHGPSAELLAGQINHFAHIRKIPR